MDIMELNEKIKEIINESGTDIGILVKDLTNDKVIVNYNENKSYVSASLIKIPIFIEALRRVDNMEIPLSKEFEIDKIQKVEYSVITEQDLDICTYEELMEWMIISSDNSATNVLIDILGLDNINNTIDKFLMNSTKLQRKMMDFKAIDEGKNNYTSLNDMLLLMEGLYGGNIEEKEICRRTLEMLKNQRDNSMLKRYIKDNVVLANKTGELDNLNNDVGIFYTKNIDYFIGVFAHNVNSNLEGCKIIGSISKVIYEYFLNGVNQLDL